MFSLRARINVLGEGNGMSSSNKRKVAGNKKRYRKPALRSGRIFERSALKCGKIDPGMQDTCWEPNTRSS
jgi:hypothetical protein